MKKTSVKPSKRLSAFIFYLRDQRKYYEKNMPEFSMPQATKEIAKKWRTLDDKAKEPFFKLSENDIERHNKEMK